MLFEERQTRGLMKGGHECNNSPSHAHELIRHFGTWPIDRTFVTETKSPGLLFGLEMGNQFAIRTEESEQMRADFGENELGGSFHSVPRVMACANSSKRTKQINTEITVNL